MSNMSTAIYANGKVDQLYLRWDRDISKRLGVRRKGVVGAKFYTTKSGQPKVAIRKNPDMDKGYRPLKLSNSGSKADVIRLGVGHMFNNCGATPTVYRFTGETMYVNIPVPFNGNNEHLHL